MVATLLEWIKINGSEISVELSCMYVCLYFAFRLIAISIYQHFFPITTKFTLFVVRVIKLYFQSPATNLRLLIEKYIGGLYSCVSRSVLK